MDFISTLQTEREREREREGEREREREINFVLLAQTQVDKYMDIC